MGTGQALFCCGKRELSINARMAMWSASRGELRLLIQNLVDNQLLTLQNAEDGRTICIYIYL